MTSDEGEETAGRPYIYVASAGDFDSEEADHEAAFPTREGVDGFIESVSPQLGPEELEQVDDHHWRAIDDVGNWAAITRVELHSPERLFDNNR